MMRLARASPSSGLAAATAIPLRALLGRTSGHPAALLLAPPAAFKCSVPLNLDHTSEHAPGRFRVKTFNKISSKGLSRFPPTAFDVSADHAHEIHAILLRYNIIASMSHKLELGQVPVTVRCVARCGAGTNNVPVAELTAMGIPVFNTPGANANAVKELVLCGLFLASRDIVGGVAHMKELGAAGLARERVEKDKANFGGREIAGKTLGIVGLGHIGSATARDASALGMQVCGYDPGITIDCALRLPRETKLLGNLQQVFATADYISLNLPFIDKPFSEGGTRGIVGEALLEHAKKDACLLNFARGELVDSKAMKAWLASPGNAGKYVTDFPDDELWDHPRAVVIPHLGASTEEAEDCAAAMAVETVMRYLQTGEILNSVNFPETKLDALDTERTVRITVVNANEPGVLSEVLSVFGEHQLNIMQQVNKSRGDVAYNVIDVEFREGADYATVQKRITAVPKVLSSRFIYGALGGFGFAVNRRGPTGEKLGWFCA